MAPFAALDAKGKGGMIDDSQSLGFPCPNGWNVWRPFPCVQAIRKPPSQCAFRQRSAGRPQLPKGSAFSWGHAWTRRHRWILQTVLTDAVRKLLDTKAVRNDR
jgi:hypothetical protein